jgi:hypothetical protein
LSFDRRLGKDRSIMRRLLACSFVALTGLTIAAGTGCRMCASPYDYCGPVVECDDCNSGNGYHPGTVAPAPADGQYYENGAAPEDIKRPAPPQNMGTPTPTPATGPMASRTQNQNPFMRSSRY